MRAAREGLGYAQDRFAVHAGVDRSYYGKLERGERQPTVGLFLRIAYALGMSAAELLDQAEYVLKAKTKGKATKRRPAKKATALKNSPRASSRARSSPER